MSLIGLKLRFWEGHIAFGSSWGKIPTLPFPTFLSSQHHPKFYFPLCHTSFSNSEGPTFPFHLYGPSDYNEPPGQYRIIAHLKNLNLIPPAIPLLPCKVAHSQAPGTRIWTFVGRALFYLPHMHFFPGIFFCLI